jgi:hypothetical protein
MSSLNETREVISGQLWVTKDKSTPPLMGIGRATIFGASYLQGPNLFGNDLIFPNVWATTMIGPLTNSDSPPPFIPGALAACGLVNNSPYSLAVLGDAVIFNNLDVNSTITAGRVVRAGTLIQSQGDVTAFCGAHRLSAKKNFDIPHPTKEGWRLTHTCIEGPEAAVYIRGRVKNQTEINLPEYWKELVDIQSITVSLTPIGSHQDVIIKRWDEKKIYLQTKGGMPIDCFYHVYVERKDTEKLIPEYKGTIEDYPGDNTQRSIAGYHYDVKE